MKEDLLPQFRQNSNEEEEEVETDPAEGEAMSLSPSLLNTGIPEGGETGLAEGFSSGDERQLTLLLFGLLSDEALR